MTANLFQDYVNSIVKKKARDISSSTSLLLKDHAASHKLDMVNKQQNY